MEETKQMVKEQFSGIRYEVDSALDTLIKERYIIGVSRVIKLKRDRERMLDRSIAELIAIRDRLEKFINEK